MKKLMSIFLVLILMLSFAGCGGSENGGNDDNKDNKDNKGNTPQMTEAESLELLRNAFKDFKRPDSFEVKGKMLFVGSKTDKHSSKKKDEESDIVNYVDGKNKRSEASIFDDTFIQIRNEDEKVIYKYFTSQKTGKKEVIKDEDLVGSNGMQYDVNNDEYWKGLKIAKMDTFLNEEIVYLELEQETGEETKELALSKIWYSTKYGIPLKEEHYLDNKLVFKVEITSITEGGDYSDKMVPPSDIKWEK